jgi:hypothetical protein
MIEGLTTRMREQHIADRFGIGVNTCNASDKVAAVTFEEDAILSPVVVFVVIFPCVFDLRIVFCVRIQHKAGKVSR